ncbi:MAG: hypothetical protein K8E66_12815, partial [Phycisphaerales bacterium]|nr:hypothetical protein [Phycisphaerales bacterium]
MTHVWVPQSSETVEPEGDQTTGGPGSIWGEHITALHDLFWASRCVQVVRPGRSGTVERHGPALYLLVGESQLVHFSLGAALKRLHWASPRLLRLRIVVHEPIDYTEHIER